MAIAAFGGFSVGVGPAIADWISPPDPYEEVIEEVGADLFEMPEFRERFESLDEDDAFRAGWELGAQVLPHLPDAELGEWLTIGREFLHAVDVDTCAATVTGSIDPDDAIAAFEVLDIPTFRRYVEIVFHAVRLDLTDAQGAHPPSPADVEGAMSLLAEQVGPSRLEEMALVLVDPSAASDVEVCSATRELYDALIELDERNRGILLRIVTDQTARIGPPHALAPVAGADGRPPTGPPRAG